MRIDVKVPSQRVPLSKITGHTKSTFQNCRLKKKLLQELVKEMDIILSNTVQSKINLIVKLIWEEQHHVEFVIIIVRKSTTAYHLHQYKTGAEFLIVPSCLRLPHKN